MLSQNSVFSFGRLFRRLDSYRNRGGMNWESEEGFIPNLSKVKQFELDWCTQRNMVFIWGKHAQDERNAREDVS